MSRSTSDLWLHRFAVLTALATLALLGVGGLVTSHGVGMAVPDWPTTYGYNMFFFPISKWTGGILYEHSHRLVASTVGILTVLLTRWLGGWNSRRLLAVIGVTEVLAGLTLSWLKPELRSTAGFLAGIGGVVLLAAAIWVRNEPANRPLLRMAWLAFWLVQFQGLLGGLRVVLFKDEIGIFHATLAQLFFALVCAIALFTSRWWIRNIPSPLTPLPSDGRGEQQLDATRKLGRFFLLTTALIFLQLILGATMRHQHAGLAIPDFPLAYGKVWPAMDADSIAAYNARRIETTAANPITAFQIGLQMAHRFVALAILICVSAVAWRVRQWSAEHRLGPMADVKHSPRGCSALPLQWLAFVWLALIMIQAGLGAWTIWSNKAADVATAHVLVGALSLVTGALGCIIAFRRSTGPVEATALAAASFGAARCDSFQGDPAAALNP
jgi:cytochrome c oxidase assembly protein subunit 15